MINPMLQRALEPKAPTGRHNVRDIQFHLPGSLSCDCGWVAVINDQLEFDRAWKQHLKNVGQKSR